jgi:trehalose/maltose hydrolase-like predicted phosphorylase
MTGSTSPISPPPVTEWRPEYLPAYLSNGLVGLRVGHLPPLYGTAMVSGFEGLDPVTGVEAFARAPYPLAGDVQIGAAALSDPRRAVLREQRYDFSCGELHTSLSLDAGEVRAEVDVVTLCSRTQPTLALQQMRVRVDRDCDLTVSAGFDAREVPGSWGEMAGGPFQWRSPGDLSSCGLAYDTELRGADRFDRTQRHLGTGPLMTSYSFRAAAGREYLLRQFSSLVPQALHSQPHMQAARLADAGRLRGFDALREENRAAWDELWRARLVLVGAPARWQALADAAFFYLQTSVHGASPSATSVFGLAYWPNYHYYRGHLMWDVETFAVPPLLLTHPEAALGLLRYRGSRLPAARANATLTGYRGAQFPWESSLRHGHEATPIGAAAPATEHHISMDVACAFARYVHATGDRQFARAEAWPVLCAVAEWIESRADATPRGYEIRRVIGIAETGTTV